MGIEGLWKEVEPLRSRASLSKFRGRTIGIDGDFLLHELGGSLGLDIAMGKTAGIAKRYAQKLKGYSRRTGVNFLVAFDGQDAPMKAEESRIRQERRQRLRSVGVELLRFNCIEEARSVLKKAPPVGEAKEAVVRALRAEGITVLRAPLEAEAQLAYMNRCGDIAGVWSGDSDAIAYYARVMIRDINPKNLECDIYYLDDAQQWRRSCHHLGQISTPELFILCCVMGGSDYTPHRHGSLQTAARVIHKARDLEEAFEWVYDHFRLSKSELQLWKDAVEAFRFHWVFDVKTERIVTNFPLPAGVDAPRLEVVGAPLPNPKQFCLEWDGTKEGETPSTGCMATQADYPLYPWPAEDDLNYLGPLDCRLCQVNSTTKEQHQIHVHGALHKAIACLADMRQV